MYAIKKTSQDVKLWSNIITLRSFLGYIFMSFVPLTSYSIPLQLGGRLIFFEMVLIFSIPLFLLQIGSGSLKIQITKLDIVLISYVFLSLISVIRGSDNLYISARDYRHLLLVPLIAYFAYKFYFDNNCSILLPIE